MRFFLTGISGFICKHLAKRLIEQRHDVDILHYENGKMTELHFLPSEFRWVDISALQKNKYDYVINLAASTSISTAFNPDIYFNNIIFAQTVLSTPHRTIYASSTSAIELNNPYAYSKAFNEHLGMLHGNALGLRLFNVYGPGNNKGIVKKMIDCFLKGEKMTLQGGHQIRDFIYVDDVVDIIIDYLDAPMKIMDVGTGVGTRVGDLIDLIRDQCERIDVVNYDYKIEFKASDYAGEQTTSIAQSHPLKQYTTLQEGIRKTIEETLKTKIC